MRLKLLKLSHDKNGITLVETMASVFIFMLVLGAILQVSVDSMSMGKRSEFAYNAYNLAKNHIETLKSMPFSTLSNAAETDVYIDSDGVSNPDGPYIRNTTVTTNYSGDPNLIQLTVSVNYTFRGTTRSNPVSLSTVVFQYA